MELVLKNNLEKLISKEKISLSKISSITGVSISTLSRILSGQIKKPNQETIQLIANYFKISPKLLFQKKMMNGDLLIEENTEAHNSIKERVVYLMKKCSIMSIDELSSLSGVNYSTIRSIIQGESENPHIETCSKLADFFGITIDQLKCFDNLTDKKTEIEYANIPVIDIKNIKSWVLTKKPSLISSFKKLSIENPKGVFAIEITDESFCIEYDIGDLLIFKETNKISIQGKYLCKIDNLCNIFKLNNEHGNVLCRLLGTSNKQLVKVSDVNIFGKLIEIRVV